MSKFAKLFERDGEQVLVLLQDNDEGRPCVRTRFSMKGAIVDVDLGFDEGKYDKQEAAFEAIDEDGVFRMREGLIRQINGEE